MGKKFAELTRAERLETQILGRLTLDRGSDQGDTFLCNTINISTSGALVETGSMIPIGSLLKYSVSLPGFDKNFDIIGEVVRGERRTQAPVKDRPALVTESESRKLIRYGIMFLDLKEDDRKAIEGYTSTDGAATGKGTQ